MLEAVEVVILDESEWDADEVSFCTTGHSTMCVAVTELDESEWDADEVSFCTTGHSTMCVAVSDEA